jgi:hypothetical protein
MMQASTQAVGDLVAAVIKDHRLERPVIVAVGGGAGALGRAVAEAMGLDIVVPPHAEVISAIGDALSLIRAERERTFHEPTPADTQRLIAEVEDEAIAAGASAATLDVRVEHVAERGAVRVTVTGAVGLSSGAIPGRQPATADDARSAAEARGYADPSSVGQYWMATRSGRGDRGSHLAVFDQYADVVIDIEGEIVAIEADGARGAEDALSAALVRHTRRLGPITMAPDAWVISGARFMQVPDPEPGSIIAIAAAIDADRDTEAAAPTIIVGRE